MKNDKWLAEILSGLDYWQDLPKSRFWFNPLYRVGVSKNTNLDFIFGVKRSFSLKNLRKLLFFSVRASFPDDSVLFFQPSRERLIVASERESKVLKICNTSFKKSLKETEVKLLKHLEQSEFASHSAKFLAEGNNWILTSFCSNRDSLSNIKNIDAYLLEHMDHLIMDPMAKFYRSFDLSKIKLSEFISKAKFRLKDHPEQDLLLKMLETIAKEQDVDLLHGQLHFDLHAGNILKDGSQVIIIDWELTHQGLLLIDYFDFYRRYLNKYKLEQQKFLNYMKGDSELPVKLAEFYKKYQDWLKSFGVYAPDPRLIFQLYSIERTLIYWEKSRANRLKDRRGLEYKIVSIGTINR